MSLTSSLLYQSGKIGDEPFILTGPVIGMVTDATARILIETSISCTVECKLKTSNGVQISQSISAEKRIPKCFNFGNLTPDTYYRITLSIPCPGLVKSGFMTMPKSWSLMNTPARLGFVTGNNYTFTRDNVEERVDLWKNLFKLTNKCKIDYLIHVGDNVHLDNDDYKHYTDKFVGKLEDNRWQTAMKELDGIPASDWPKHYERICEIFRGGYREAWNHPMTKHTLANVPNLMILNDHDICTSFGDRMSDYDPYSLEYFLCCCSYEVYNEFQRNLFEDYTAPKTPYACTSEVHQAYHFHVFGDIGIMFLDVRAARTLHRNFSKDSEKDEKLPLLGYRQWKDIEFALSDTGYFSGCRMLFLVSPTPPAAVGESGSKFIQSCKGASGTCSGSWYSDESIPETSYMLSLMFDWRAKNHGQREICIVAGGMGQGFMTDIVDTRYTKLYDGRLDRLKQITLGPIANDGPTIVNKKVLNQAVGKINSISPHHQFKHYNVSRFRQFGVIDVYLDYNELHPERGIVTKFTAQVTTCNTTQVTTLKPVDASFRVNGNFKGTFLSMCDPGAERPPRYSVQAVKPSERYALLSGSASEDNDGESRTASVIGTYDDVSIPLSIKAANQTLTNHKIPGSKMSISSSYSSYLTTTGSSVSSSYLGELSNSYDVQKTGKKSRNLCNCRTASEYCAPTPTHVSAHH